MGTTLGALCPSAHNKGLQSPEKNEEDGDSATLGECQVANVKAFTEQCCHVGTRRQTIILKSIITQTLQIENIQIQSVSEVYFEPLYMVYLVVFIYFVSST